MSYVDPCGRKGVEAEPFRKLFAQIVDRHCGGSVAAAGRLCGFGSTALSHRVMHSERIEHITGKKVLATWRRLKSEGALVERAA